MRKFAPIFLLVIVALLAAACSQANNATPAAEATPQPQVTATAGADQPVTSGDTSFVCEPFAVLPTPRAFDEVGLRPVDENDHVRGAANPRLTLIEYSDFECPYCAVAAEETEKLLAEFPDTVQVVFRQYPLISIHDKAALAAQASEAAGLQGKFFEMHDALFAGARAQEWQEKSVAEFETYVGEKAAEIGLDVAQFQADLNSEPVQTRVENQYNEAGSMGLTGTPSFFIVSDGQVLYVPKDQIPWDAATMKTLLTLLDLKDRQYAACPPTVIDPAKDYTATLKTAQGDIKIKLFADQAPIAVNSFVFLAQNDYYDNVTFHRVLPGFVAQGGDPSGTGFGGPGYRYKNEVVEGLNFDRAGLVALANSGPDSNGSQFFITYAPATELNGGYTIFGEVIEGLDIAEQLTPRDPRENPDAPAGDLILDVIIEEN
jgi:cyclophilin family peptidyl-prolyl cis-trans isomerase/protein-disulfide isomerase